MRLKSAHLPPKPYKPPRQTEAPEARDGDRLCSGFQVTSDHLCSEQARFKCRLEIDSMREGYKRDLHCAEFENASMTEID
jgi:hypothetical protein